MARRSTISRDDVVDAALEIIDADDGVGSLSLEAIAKRLGVRGPSLYHYFTDKNEILDAVAARVIGNLDMRHGSDNWVEWLIERSVQFQVRVMEHPERRRCSWSTSTPSGRDRLRPRRSDARRSGRSCRTPRPPAARRTTSRMGSVALPGVLGDASTSCRARCRSVPRTGGGARCDPDDDGLQSLERAVRGFITGVLIEHAMHGGSRSAADARSPTRSPSSNPPRRPRDQLPLPRQGSRCIGRRHTDLHPRHIAVGARGLCAEAVLQACEASFDRCP